MQKKTGFKSDDDHILIKVTSFFCLKKELGSEFTEIVTRAVLKTILGTLMCDSQANIQNLWGGGGGQSIICANKEPEPNPTIECI